MTKRPMTRTFSNIRFDRSVLAYLGRYPRQVNRCLKRTFRRIRDGEVTLHALPLASDLYYLHACNHQIIISVHRPSNTVVILDLIPLALPGGIP